MIEKEPKTRKVSKKTKKSWRKNVDIRDVEKFLDDSRQEERLGSFKDHKDDQLFVITTKPEVLPKKTRRDILLSKEPRCFNSLKPHSAVPDPISKRNRVRTAEERKHPIRVEKEVIREAAGILKLKDRLRLRNKAIAAKKRLIKPKRGEFKEDVWNGKVESPIDTEWLNPDTVRHTMTHFGVKKKKIPTTLRKKPSALPAVEPPHPGTSYNPSYEDHQHLLREIAQKELEIEKEEKHLDRVTSKMFRKVSPEQKEQDLLNEMSEGLNLENQEPETNEDNGEMKSVNPPVKNVKKTRKQRRKQKEQKALTHEMVKKKLEKKKISDIYRLRMLDKHLAKKESKQSMLREKRLQKKSLKATSTKVLSRRKFEPLEPEFKLPDELAGNLRNSMPTGNLLKDRFKSLQQRNIVAPSALKLKREKAKVKRFIKPDHKINMSDVKLASLSTKSLRRNVSAEN